MKTQILTTQQIKQAAEIITNGGIIAFPTETVYGLGVIYDNKEAFDKLVAIKNRQPNKPFTLICCRKDQIHKYAEVSGISQKIINAFLPGPLTIVLPSKANLPKWVDFSIGQVGIRVSSMKVVEKLITAVGKPLLVPSANKRDERPAQTGAEALAIFDGQIEAIINGRITGGVPSTVIEVDRHDKIRLLREGPISLQQIMEVLNK